MCSQADDPSQHSEIEPLRAALEEIAESWGVGDMIRDRIPEFLDQLERAALAASATDEPKPCARYWGSDGTFCSTHNGRFVDDGTTGGVMKCDRALAASATDEGPDCGITGCVLTPGHRGEHLDVSEAGWVAQRARPFAASATDEGPRLDTPEHLRAASPEPREDARDHIAWAQHVRAEHEATHGEAEQCGAECIVLGLTEFEDATPATGPDERAALDRCPVCGTPGSLVSSDEGTSHFRPAAPAKG